MGGRSDFDYSIREAGWLVALGDKILQSSPRKISGQKNPSLAFEAFDADVGPNLGQFSFIAAAGVRLAQADYVTELHFGRR